MSHLDQDEVIKKALDNSLKLDVPAIRRDNAYIIYSVAYLTALGFRGIQAIDAGAGVGFSTLQVAKALYESGVEGRIYAIEKDIQRFRKLEELVDAFLNEVSKGSWKTIIVPTEEGVSISFKTKG